MTTHHRECTIRAAVAKAFANLARKKQDREAVSEWEYYHAKYRYEAQLEEERIKDEQSRIATR